jgi:GNAT superfamily N-acetyltransferase
MPGAPTLPATVTLDDGREVVVRGITPADGPALAAFHDSLSPESTRLRYFTVHPHLTDRELRRFTTVDHSRREGLLAFDGDRIVAYACVDDVADGIDAEVAFVVAEGWRNRGLATRLLGLLGDVARSHGFHHLVAETFSENAPMASVFEHSSLPERHTVDHGVAFYTMDLDRAGP